MCHFVFPESTQTFSHNHSRSIIWSSWLGPERRSWYKNRCWKLEKSKEADNLKVIAKASITLAQKNLPLHHMQPNLCPFSGLSLQFGSIPQGEQKLWREATCLTWEHAQCEKFAGRIRKNSCKRRTGRRWQLMIQKVICIQTCCWNRMQPCLVDGLLSSARLV